MQATPFKPGKQKEDGQFQLKERMTVDIYKLAIKLTEAKLGSFDECTRAVRDNDCDEDASIKALQRNN